MGTWLAPNPDQWPYGPLSGAAEYPAGARPCKCIIIIPVFYRDFIFIHYDNALKAQREAMSRSDPTEITDQAAVPKKKKPADHPLRHGSVLAHPKGIWM
jgi:hypothetical protein